MGWPPGQSLRPGRGPVRPLGTEMPFGKPLRGVAGRGVCCAGGERGLRLAHLKLVSTRTSIVRTGPSFWWQIFVKIACEYTAAASWTPDRQRGKRDELFRLLFAAGSSV